MIEAVLFDLDGTLLENDMGQFMPLYLRALSAHVAHLMPPAQFVPSLIAATEKMAANDDPDVTNEAAFWAAFEGLAGVPQERFQALTDEFYVEKFAALSSCTRRRPRARTLVQHVMETGRRTVVATHPLFPRRAILHRMEWAGVGDLPFTLITSYENFHTSKPRPTYYAEIAAQIGVPPARCLMIGDDRAMDGPAVQAGMRFFWVTEERPFGDERGNLEHLDVLIQAGWLDR